MTRTWATNWSDQAGLPHEVITSFTHDTDGGCRMTMPDGTVYKEYYAGSAGVPPAPAWQNGLLLETRNYASAADASSNLWQKRTTTAWTQDNLSVSYLTNPRVTQTDIDDRDGNHRRTTIDYGDTNLGYVQWGLPYIVKEYGVVGTTATELRRTQTDYNLTQAYLNQRIIGLVSSTKLYDPIAAQWQAKTTYTYDGTTVNTQATTATQHDQGYNSSFTARGNVTSVSRWDVTDISNANKALTSSVTYNAAGSAVSSTDPANHTSSISYADSFSDNQNHNTFAYPTTATDADGFSSTVQYRYEYGAKTRVQTPLPNVTTNQPGPVTTFEYDDALRIKRVTSLTNNAYTRYEYGADYMESFSSVNNVADEAFTFQLLNGLGQVFIAGGYHPGSAGGYRAAKTYYDQMGRVMKQSNPTEIGSGWTPAGDDAYNAQTDTGGYRYTEQTYDWKGRPIQTTHPDGTYTTASYSGCGCAGGEVVTLTDEMSRQQKVYADVLGRQWKSEVLNWNGTVYSTTTNTFNALDQVALMRQTDNATGTYQDTTMSFDGYGRLQTKHVPEQQADPNNSGTSDHTTWGYFADDTIQKVTDARGASATYAYNNRHLITGITYAVPQGSNIPSTPNVTFGYDAAGNRTSMTDGLGSQSYSYDSLSRMTSETRTFGSPLNQALTLSYEYNLANQVKKVTDQTSVTSFSSAYDNSGRVGSVSTVGYGGATTQFVSQIQYRAWAAPKSLAYGNNTSIGFGYNARGLITDFTANFPANSYHSGSAYQYYADRSLKFAQDQSSSPVPIKDRAYSYDHVGRLAEAYSGAQARDFMNNTSGGVVDGPYRQSYAHDAWGNTTNENWRLWSRNGTTSTLYSSNRNTLWSYDADGNVLTRDDAHYAYNAAGDEITQTQDTTYYDSENQGMVGLFLSNSEGHDGGGQLLHYVKRMDHNFNGSTPINAWTTEIYNLRSTVLGGRVISEYTGNGTWIRSYVYAGTERVGQQSVSNNSATNGWRYVDPVTGDEGNAVLDPQGVDVGLENPFPPGGGGDPSLLLNGEPLKATARPLAMEGGGAQCVLDGIRMDCGFIRGEISVQCPDNDCGPRVDKDGNLTEPFHAFADGHSGFLPQGAKYLGDGSYLAPPDEDNPDGRPGSFEENEFSGDLNMSFPQNTPGQKGTPGFTWGDVAKFDSARFQTCLGKFPVTNGTFSGTRQGGSFSGEHNGKAFTVNFNAKKYTSEGIRNYIIKHGLTPAPGRALGMAPSNDPIVYIASDFASDSNAKDIAVTAVEVHELGNKLAQKFFNKRNRPRAQDGLLRKWDSDSGMALEECVFGGVVASNTGQVGVQKK